MSETQKTAPDTNDPTPAPAPPADFAATPADEQKRGRGRPRKDAPPPLTPEPPPAKRKTPQEMRDIRAALLRNHEDRKVLIARYREEHPESEIADDKNPFETKRAMGAPIPANAFEAPLRMITKGVAAMGGLEKDELPTDDQYKACAEEWGRASTHLGWTERAAALFSAVSSTVLIVGGTIVKAATKKKAKPADDRKPAPVVALNKASVKVDENAK